MNQSVTTDTDTDNTIVKFDRVYIDQKMSDWLLDIAPLFRVIERNYDIISISFRYPEDAIIFKLKFGL
jgi:hypothetical protein